MAMTEADQGWKDRLRERLKARGWTYRELAEKAGLKSETHVSSLLAASGPRSPNGETLVRLARALGVSSDWLMTGDDTPEPPSAVVVRDSEHTLAFRRFRDLPGWTEAEAEARRIYGDELPEYCWGYAGNLAADRWPTVITAKTVFLFAKTCFEQASDEQRVEREREEVRAAKAAWRASQERRGQ